MSLRRLRLRHGFDNSSRRFCFCIKTRWAIWCESRPLKPLILSVLTVWREPPLALGALPQTLRAQGARLSSRCSMVSAAEQRLPQDLGKSGRAVVSTEAEGATGALAAGLIAPPFTGTGANGFGKNFSATWPLSIKSGIFGFAATVRAGGVRGAMVAAFTVAASFCAAICSFSSMSPNECESFVYRSKPVLRLRACEDD